MAAAGQEVLAARLGGFLDKAAEAEAQGDLAEGERLFRLALFCEARLRADVPDAAAYVRSAGPLYPGARVNGRHAPVSGNVPAGNADTPGAAEPRSDDGAGGQSEAASLA